MANIELCRPLHLTSLSSANSPTYMTSVYLGAEENANLKNGNGLTGTPALMKCLR